MKRSILIIITVILAVILYIIGYYTYICIKVNKQLEQDSMAYYIPRESIIYNDKWKKVSKEFILNVRNKQIPLEIVFSIMKTEQLSIEQMDSIIGDSLWRK